MKRIRIMILVLACLIASSFIECEAQEVKLKIEVDERLHSIMDHFILHAEAYELDTRRFEKLVLVRFASVEELSLITDKWIAGVTRYDLITDTYKIYLSEEIIQYGYEFIEIVLYHELWHTYANDEKHCDEPECLFIFNTGTGPDDIPFWHSGSIEEYFLTLKNL